MKPTYRIFVSSDNNNYSAWQTILFCYSALSRLGQRPTVILHSPSQAPLIPEYLLLREVGFDIVTAPSFRVHPKGLYLPRNEIGSLVVLGEMSLDTEWILFCEPDMVFTKSLEFDPCLSAEHYDYLTYDEPRVQSVVTQLGLVGANTRLNTRAKVGVPYFLPSRDVRRLAARWLDVIDRFEELCWIDIMYAFGIALDLEHLSCRSTYQMDLYAGPHSRVTRSLIHYCNSDKYFDKQSFLRNSPFAIEHDHLLPHGAPGTVLGEITTQLREAKRYFYSEH